MRICDVFYLAERGREGPIWKALTVEKHRQHRPGVSRGRMIEIAEAMDVGPGGKPRRAKLAAG